MSHIRILLLKLFIALCFVLSIAEAKSKTKSKTKWQFKNWNHYKGASVGRGSKWGKKWGISEDGGWQWIWNGKESAKHAIVKDPSGKSEMTLQVKYPVDSKNPESNPVGGLGFKAQPITIGSNIKKVELTYSVYFKHGFDFVKGGKLPGLYGGHGSCTGGADDKTCFTARLMWRAKGEGEIYAYLPYSNKPKNLCGKSDNICNPNYGMSLGRGTFRFETGKWNNIRQVITMNTPGKQNGRLVLYKNNRKVYTQNNVVFLTSSAGRVAGIMFHTFFGGSDNSWESPKAQYSYFKGFSLKASY
ncbi:hypothetical protein BY458DRAFT_531473 [Sporodiniella umbellata]|nr:hypothetical protein BY458DRAFT_531473 [Sporodiniella umbellata]